ncbi:MAG TPA: NUDIX domain-containing protein [Ktedonobacteraceae bacterium]|nr:NUDIX domain-containing protein [Ktedonobacteraceae bacterium]
MPEQRTLEKVTAFITDEARSHLLVFRHPSAGVQVPAGTVEAGETAEHAVLRETYEESGLQSVRIVARLQPDLVQDFTGATAPTTVLLQVTTLLTEPTEEAPPTGRLTRGTWVRVTHSHEDWTHVIYEEIDMNSVPPQTFPRFQGWIPTTQLASRLVRSFYHVVVNGLVPRSWEHQAEGKYRFSYYWLPLRPRPQLVEGQDIWLRMVYNQLIA